MISSKELLRRTGLKSAKTLTRWYKLGLIPKPELRTHPSGRGKLSYWPDWVLDRCLKMREAQKHGRSLKGAVSLMALEYVERTMEETLDARNRAESLSKRRVKVAAADGKEFSGLDIFIALILADLHPRMLDKDRKDVLIAKLRDSQALDQTLRAVEQGFNPVLVFDGSQVHITTDFMLGIRLGLQGDQGRPAIIVPLLHPLRRALVKIGDGRRTEPRMYPAMKVWERSGEKLVEMSLYALGVDGFQVVRESAEPVAQARAKRDKSAP
jgi:DNA-binding transcriptional MerR regulator